MKTNKTLKKCRLEKTEIKINEILRERRLELGISQEKLTRHCGFSYCSSISRLENEEIEWKFKDVVRAAELLKIKIEIKELKNEQQ